MKEGGSFIELYYSKGRKEVYSIGYTIQREGRFIGLYYLKERKVVHSLG